MRSAIKIIARRAVFPLGAAILLAAAGTFAEDRTLPGEMARVPGGVYQPVYAGESKERETVRAFWLDLFPVTNADFANFTRAKPEWGPGRPARIKADHLYLAHWQGGAPNPGQSRIPVTNVSWFAARAYCASRGKRLATVAEWEHAAAAADAAFPREGEAALLKRILEWYSRPNADRPAGSVFRNVYGVYDLHGSVWEWTFDFNSVTIDSDSRERGQSSRFCGAGGLNASNPRDYAAFMRQAFRSGLTAASTARNLGFRCARDL
jgi:formylglycine-generating enzyme